MVGKLDDMVTAAVVVDSTPKTAPISEKDFAQVQQQSALKPSVTQVAKEQEQGEERLVEPGTMSEESVSQMTEVFNELMDKINCDVEFQYNKEIDMFNVKMIDKETKEVIKEFPPEEMIENMIKARDWLGAFIDKAV